MKIRPVEAKGFHTDGQTDGRTEEQTDMTKFFEILRTTPKNYLTKFKFM